MPVFIFIKLFSQNIRLWVFLVSSARDWPRNCFPANVFIYIDIAAPFKSRLKMPARDWSMGEMLHSDWSTLAQVRNEGRCLVIREKVWDYMSYKLRILKVRKYGYTKYSCTKYLSSFCRLHGFLDFLLLMLNFCLRMTLSRIGYQSVRKKYFGVM